MCKIPTLLILSFTLVLARTHRATAGTEDSHTLFTAIRQGDIKVIRQALHAGTPVDARDGTGATPLIQAALYGDVRMLRLILDAGAAVNATNKAGVSALLRGSGDPAKARLLLDHGADPNAASALGNTPLILAARCYGNSDTVKRLLDRDAAVNATNKYGVSAIMMAGASGDIRTTRLLIQHHADVNALPGAEFSSGGRTAVMWAALLGHNDCLELLLQNGANVNGMTNADATGALAQAAWTDETGAAEILLRHGAHVDQRDFAQYTPLLWASGTETGDPALVRLLLAHGADPNAEGGEPIEAFLGVPQTPRLLAEKRGHTRVVDALVAAGAKATAAKSGKTVVPPTREIPAGPLSIQLLREAITKALPPLQETATESRVAFLRHASHQDCISCHQQLIPMTAIAVAHQKGLGRDETAVQEQLKLVGHFIAAEPEDEAQPTFHPAAGITTGYAAMGLAYEGRAAGPVLDAAVHQLTALQAGSGRWENYFPRPPIQSGHVASTALGIRALQLHPLPGRSAEFHERVGRAAGWLRKVQPAFHDERVFQLLGLAWSGDSPRQLNRLTEALRAEQRRDGGWAQLPGLESDAYATGQALFALHEAAHVPATDDAYQRGLRFLLKSQLEDGTWFTARRAFPFQPTMTSGFPHGRDSWISATSTSWAILALSLACDPADKPGWRAGL